MFCSKHVDVKRHSVYFPEIKKTFAVSSLVLNLLASQTGDFFLPHPVYALFYLLHTYTMFLLRVSVMSPNNQGELTCSLLKNTGSYAAIVSGTPVPIRFL